MTNDSYNKIKKLRFYIFCNKLLVKKFLFLCLVFFCVYLVLFKIVKELFPYLKIKEAF